MAGKKSGIGVRWQTGAIILFASAGVLFFGVRAILENRRTPSDNPFEYQMHRIERDDDSLDHFQEVSRITVQIEKPTALALGTDGALFVCGQNGMIRYSQDGTGRRIQLPFTPTCATAMGGMLFLGAGDHVEVYAEDGIHRATWPLPSEKTILTSLAVGGESVYAADAGSGVVWQYDREGRLHGALGKTDSTLGLPGLLIPSPYFDVAVDPDGFLWAANTGRHSLENYTHEGGLRTSWGEYGNGLGDFCGCCNPAHFSIMEDGSFVTSEKGVVRVKIYDRTGRLTGLVAGPEQFPGTHTGHDVAARSGKIYILDPRAEAVRIFEKVQDD
jgi:sugar lactone lactonase YvrE